MAEYVYLMEGADAIKVGISDNPERRLREVAGRLGVGARVVRTVTCVDRARAFELESGLHKVLAPYRLEGERFGVECFQRRCKDVVIAFFDAIPAPDARGTARRTLRAWWLRRRARQSGHNKTGQAPSASLNQRRSGWMSAASAAAVFGVVPDTLRKWVERGQIARRGTGTNTEYLVPDVYQWQSIRSLARVLGVSQRTVNRRVRDGQVERRGRVDGAIEFRVAMEAQS